MLHNSCYFLKSLHAGPVTRNLKIENGTLNIRMNKRIIFYLILTLGILWLIRIYQILIAPILIGAIIAYLLNPIVTALANKTRVTHRRAVNITFIIFTALILVFVAFASPVVLKQSNSLSEATHALIQRISSLQPRLEKITGASFPLEKFVIELENDLEQLLMPERLYRLLLTTTSNFIYIVIALVVCFHLLHDWTRLRDFLIGFFPDHKNNDIQTLLSNLNEIWKNYLRVELP